MRSCILGALALAAPLALATSGHAALLSHEGFDYTASQSLAGLNGGSGWAGGWAVPSGAYPVTETSLSSPASPFPSVGNRVQGTGGNAVREFDGVAFDMTQPDTAFYVSFLFRKNTNGGTSNDNVEFSMDDTALTGAELRFGSTSGEIFFFGATSNTLPAPLVIGQTYFVVLKVVSSAVGNDQFFASIYDDVDSPSTSEPLAWDLTHSAAVAHVYDAIRLTAGSNASGAWDEIRIGTDFADVAVPEPAGLGLIGLGALAGRRRRR